MADKNYEVETTETEVCEEVESKNNDLARNVAAVGIGGLAVVGAINMGKWIYDKATKFLADRKDKKETQKPQGQPESTSESETETGN